MPMRNLPILLLILLAAPMVQAELSDDARMFLKPNEEFVDITSVQYQGNDVTAFRGSDGTMILLDSKTGSPLSPDASVDALAGVRITISRAEAQEITARAKA